MRRSDGTTEGPPAHSRRSLAPEVSMRRPIYVKQLGAFDRLCIQFRLQQALSRGYWIRGLPFALLVIPFSERGSVHAGVRLSRGAALSVATLKVNRGPAVTPGTGRSLSPQLVKVLKLLWSPFWFLYICQECRLARAPQAAWR